MLSTDERWGFNRWLRSKPAGASFSAAGGAAFFGGPLRARRRFAIFPSGELPLPAGALYLSSYDHRDDFEELERALQAANARAPKGPAWARIYAEDKLAEMALRRAGWSPVAWQVDAMSALRCFWQRPDRTPAALPLPAWASEFAQLPAPIEGAALLDLGPLPSSLFQSFRAELQACLEEGGSRWGPHYSHYGRRWSGLSLRGFSPDPQDIIAPTEMSATWKRQHPERFPALLQLTRLAEFAPELLRFAASFSGGAGAARIRFLQLAPGGRIGRHSDSTCREAGLSDGAWARIHVPLLAPPEARLEGLALSGQWQGGALEEGRIYYLDQRKPHQGENRGALPRIHFVFDALSSPLLRARLAAALELPALAALK